MFKSSFISYLFSPLGKLFPGGVLHGWNDLYQLPHLDEHAGKKLPQL